MGFRALSSVSLFYLFCVSYPNPLFAIFSYYYCFVQRDSDLAVEAIGSNRKLHKYHSKKKKGN